MFKKLLEILLMCSLLLAVFMPVSAKVYTTDGKDGVHESIFVAGNPDFYPIEYYDSSAKSYEGVMPRILNDLSERTGIDFTYIHNGEKQQELAGNMQVEIVSAYITDNKDSFAADEITLFSYKENGSMVNVGLAFTDIADKSLIAKIKAESRNITEKDINGYFMSGSMTNPDSHTAILIVFLICCILLVALTVLLIIRLNTVKKRDRVIKMTDPVTGIGNLLYFEYHFENTISDFSRCLYYIAYIIIDVNYLQVYHGASTFNDVVKYTAGVLASYSGNNDVAARITENGFAFAFQCINPDDAKQQIDEIINKLNKYTDAEGNSNKPVFHAAFYNLTSFDRNCELVLFNLRRNCIKIIGTPEQTVYCDAQVMNSALEEKGILENFERGFRNREFKLYLQFIVDNKTKKIVSAEALSRWDDPKKGIISPGKHIESMETAGLISRLDFYMFEMVCAQLDKWKDTEFSDLSISCNFTRITLSEENFLEKLKSISAKYSFDKSKLIMEITEDAIEQNFENALSNVTECKKMGFTIALDDLGSGYTSLINLCDYPIDIVKMDRAILLKTDTKKGRELFDGMIALSHSLNLRVVCEGVETEVHNGLVTASECDYIQGWYYSRAFPVEESEGFIKHYKVKNVV